MTAGMSCPDGGACHHGCAQYCVRVQTCGPLSGVYPGNRWPVLVTAEHTPPQDHAADLGMTEGTAPAVDPALDRAAALAHDRLMWTTRVNGFGQPWEDMDETDRQGWREYVADILSAARP